MTTPVGDELARSLRHYRLDGIVAVTGLKAQKVATKTISCKIETFYRCCKLTNGLSAVPQQTIRMTGEPSGALTWPC